MDLEHIVGRERDGSIAWQITVEEPMCDELGPIGVPGVLRPATSSGQVVMIED